MENQKRRQLAAVMFTDIKGFTALMQQDEQEATAVRDTHRRIFEEVTAKFNGKILQYFGDGTLSMFDSAVDAVQCSVELQKNWRSESLDVRIGIHMGDIIIYENEDVIGDSVNVASRIESLGEPGAVLLSDKVYSEIRNHTEFQVKSMGTFPLKNVSYEPEIYALDHSDLVVPSKDQLTKKVPKTKKGIKALPVTLMVLVAAAILYYMFAVLGIGSENRPAPQEQYIKLAVMPFKNINHADGVEYLSVGITEDLIGRLGRMPGLRVVSSRSTMKYGSGDRSWKEIGDSLKVAYAIDGNIQYFPSQLKVNIHLVEVESEVNLWTKVFEGTIQESYELQALVSGSIASELDLTYLTSRGGDYPDIDSVAQTHYYRGLWYLQNGVAENAISSFKLAIGIEGDYSEALFRLLETQYMLSSSTGKYLEDIEDENLLGKFSNIANDSEQIDYLMAWSEHLSGNDDQALGLLIDLEDYFHSSAYYYVLRSSVYENLGKNQGASVDMDTAIELDPLVVELLQARSL